MLLGSTTATGLPSDLFAQQEQRWLAVKAEGQPEQPRVLLVSVPYAMKAAEADRLAGHSVSEFVTTDNLQSAVQQQLQGQATTVSAGSRPARMARARRQETRRFPPTRRRTSWTRRPTRWCWSSRTERALA